MKNGGAGAILREARLTRGRHTLNSCYMKNVTITLDEEVIRWAKVWAARNDTSVSRMLGEELRRKMENERDYRRAKKRYLSREPRKLKARGQAYPQRDSLYER